MSDWSPPSSESPSPPPRLPAGPPVRGAVPPPPVAPPGSWRPVGAGPPSSPPPASPKRWIVPVLAGLVALVAAAGVWFVLTDDGEPDEDAAAVDDERDADRADDPPPSDRDEVVAELVAFVEQERGLEFLTDPVVIFQDDDAFEQGLLDLIEEETTEEDLQLLLDYYRALGLVPSDADLDDIRAIFDALYSGAVLGYYSTETKELVVRAGEITPYARQTLAHELVHALEDQHFGIEREELDDLETEDALGFLGLSEGSAEYIGQRYEASLSDDERRELLAEQAAFGADFDFSGIPFFLLDNLTAPYAEGPDLVAAILADGGQEALDAAFDDPPVTSEQWLDPDAYLEGEGPRPVPEPPADGPVIERAAYGALFWQSLFFFEVRPTLVARAVDGWGGDAGVLYEDGDRRCVRVNVVGDTDADTRELLDAMNQRGAAGADDFSAELDDGVVTFTSCG